MAIWSAALVILRVIDFDALGLHIVKEALHDAGNRILLTMAPVNWLLSTVKTARA